MKYSPLHPHFLIILFFFRIDHFSDLVLQHGQGVLNELMISISNLLQGMEDSTTSCYFFALTFGILFKGFDATTIENKIFELLTSIQAQSHLNISFSTGIVPVSRDFGNRHEIIRGAENAIIEANNKEAAPIKIATHILEGHGFDKKTVMLIEPNEDLSLILQTAFAAHDLTVKVFSDGKPALQELLSSTAAQLPSLIIAERKLSDMDGIEILKSLNMRFKSPVPFYFLTDFAAEKDVSEGLKFGALEYITKPFNLALLIQKTLRTIAL